MAQKEDIAGDPILNIGISHFRPRESKEIALTGTILSFIEKQQLIFFPSTGYWTQSLAQGRQAFYHRATSSLLFIYLRQSSPKWPGQALKLWSPASAFQVTWTIGIHQHTQPDNEYFKEPSIITWKISYGHRQNTVSRIQENWSPVA